MESARSCMNTFRAHTALAALSAQKNALEVSHPTYKTELCSITDLSCCIVKACDSGMRSAGRIKNISYQKGKGA